MTNFDLAIFNYIHGFAGKNEWLDLAGIFFAKYALYVFIISALLWAIAKPDKIRPRLAVFFLALGTSLVSRFLVVELIRLILPKPRPYVFFNFEPLVSEIMIQGSAFPSGHAAFMFAFVTILAIFFRRASWLYALAFTIGVARVFAGVHWPADIIAGAVVGIGTALLIHLLTRRFTNRVIQHHRAGRNNV